MAASAAVPEDATVATQQRQDNPDDLPPGPPPAVHDEAGLGRRGAARRRLTKAGLGAAGVLWTLESQATNYGKDMVCKAPSGAVSTGLKSTKGPKSTCQGWPPSAWCLVGHYWPCSDKIAFDSIFRCTTTATQRTYGRVSLMDVLKGKSWDNYGLGAQLAAAYLNVMTRKITFLTEEDVRDMWRQIQRGLYQASPEVPWNAKQLAHYLDSTHY